VPVAALEYLACRRGGVSGALDPNLWDATSTPSRSWRVCPRSNRLLVVAMMVALVVPAAVAGPPENASPIFRFWSDLHSRHLLTSDRSAANELLARHTEQEWAYDGIAFYAFAEAYDAEGVVPAYRFQSAVSDAYFDTISEAERDFLESDPDRYKWWFRGIEFYVLPHGDADSMPVYRFWSRLNNAHYYTINETTKDYLLDLYDEDEMALEGVAWYAYPNQHLLATGRLRLAWAPTDGDVEPLEYRVYYEEKWREPAESVDLLLDTVAVDDLADPRAPSIEFPIGADGLELRTGERACFRLTAYDGVSESDYSEEVCTLVP